MALSKYIAALAVVNSSLGIGFAWLLRGASESQLHFAGVSLAAILLLAAWQLAKLWRIDLGRGILGWMAANVIAGVAFAVARHMS